MIPSKTKRTLYVATFFGIIAPSGFVFATFRTFARDIVDILNGVALLIMGLALVFFIIGVIRFMVSAGNEQSRAQGKQLLIWGTISLFVMVSVWGIIQIISNTFFG